MGMNRSEEDLDHHEVVWGDEGQDNEDFIKGLHVFVAYIAPFFYIQGIIGNIFVLFVFLKSRSYRTREVVDYLIPLSIVDLIFLIFFALLTWLHLDVPNAIFSEGEKSYTDIFSTSARCKGISYVGLCGAFWASWTIVLFTWERMVLVWREKVVMSRKLRYILLGVIFMVGLLSMICVLVAYDIDDDGHSVECWYALDREEGGLLSYLGPFLIHCAVYTLPMILVWIGNAIIACKLCRGDKSTDEEYLNRRKKERKVAYQLVAISALFLFFTTPYSILDCWGHVLLYKIDILGEHEYALKFTSTVFALHDFLLRFVFLNNCFNYLIYIISLDWFRAEVRAMFGCKKQQEKYNMTVEPSKTEVTQF
ncbi:thyrotropin-releasing hormone receptor-like [Tubulanus polymorphus]|uniref:thyrotropin-releasing hormone receptor-like n=1 Tax=Tubulanus polymorphus TaxID=672921 RepID=UPI003DA2BFFA